MIGRCRPPSGLRRVTTRRGARTTTRARRPGTGALLALLVLGAGCGAAEDVSLPLATGTPVDGAVAPDGDELTGSGPATGTGEGSGAGTGDDTSDGDTGEPDGDPDAPDGDTDVPDGDTDVPDGDTDAPDGDTDAPDGDTDAPDGDADAPDGDGPAAAPTDRDTAPAEDELARPRPADVASLVRRELADAGERAEHVVVDLDGDELVEVVVVSPTAGEIALAVWWWEPGAGFAAPRTASAGAGRAVTGLRAVDLTGDDVRDVLVRIGGGARDSLAVWAVEDRAIRPVTGVGGCFHGTNVFGSTGAFLQSRGDDPPAIVATCDDSPLPVADWSTAVYEYGEGAYLFTDGGQPGV